LDPLAVLALTGAAKRNVVGLLIAIVAMGAGGRASAKVGWDPFRGPQKAGGADPVRVADAGATSGTQAPPEPARTCRQDSECEGEAICQEGTCQPIQIRTNVLYLYYRDGAFKEALLLYWARKGTPGYTVVAPIYWHYWAASSETRIVAPFYWHFADRSKGSVLTVIVPGLPIAWGHERGGSSFAIWPLLYGSTKYGWAVPFLGTFHINDPETRRAVGAVGYLYWWWRTPRRSTDLVLPIAFSRRTAEHAFTYAVPLNFYWRNKDDATLLALPLFYSNTHKTGASFYTWLGYARREGAEYGKSALWLYWWGGDTRARSSYHVLFPLVWDFERREGGDTVIFPVLWSFRSPATNTTVAFPLLHVRDGSATFNTVFPLYWSWSDAKAGASHRVLFPFVYASRNDRDRTRSFITPLGGYTRDDRDGTRTWGVLPLLAFAHRDPGGEHRVWTPLYYSHRDLTRDAMSRLVGLLFYRRTDPGGSTTVLFPVFGRFWDAATGATATALFPLYEHRSGPRDSTTLLGPFYWRRFRNGGWGAGLFPLAYFGHNANRSHAIVFPLLWHVRSETSTTTLLLPISYQRIDAEGSDQGLLPLLWFAGQHGQRSYNVQFPFLWQLKDDGAGTATTVTPFGYAHRDRGGSSFAVGPILPLVWGRSGRDRSHFVLFPIVWHFVDRSADRSTTVVGPFWHRRWGGETTDALFPILHYRRGVRPGGADAASFTLFPLVHYRREADSRVFVTPVAASFTSPLRRVGFVGPYFWYADKDISARFIPLIHADITRSSDGQRLRQYGPWFRIDGGGAVSQGLFPLFGRYSDNHERDTWVFPGFFQLRRENGDAVDTFLPLFWRSSFGDRRTTVVGPFFSRRNADAHSYGLVPLFVRATNTRRSMTIVPPLLLFSWRDADDRNAWSSCAAIFFHSRTPDGANTGVFPIFWSKRSVDRRHDIVFPIYWHFANATAGTNWTLAGPVLWSKNRTRRTFGVLPLGWVSRDAANREASGALLPFFYASRGPARASFFTLVGGYHRNGPSHFWYAGPIVHTESVQARFSALVPLWFRRTNKATETTTTVIPPLLTVAREGPEAGFWTTLALIWNRHDISSSTTLGLPLYFDSHDYRLSRLTVFLPFVFRYANEVQHDTYWVVPPLFFRKATPANISMVAFPLVWDFKRGADWRTTVVFPFFARWRRPDYTGTYVFPSYYYREGRRADGAADGTYRRFVLPFYDSGVKRPGDFMWEVLGGLFGHERIGTHNFLRLFYLTFETSPPSRAQAGWYGQRPAPRRKATPRGLSVAGW
jgi:hypothetical protein